MPPFRALMRPSPQAHNAQRVLSDDAKAAWAAADAAREEAAQYKLEVSELRLRLMEELEAKVENQQQVVDIANQMRQLRLQHQSDLHTKQSEVELLAQQLDTALTARSMEPARDASSSPGDTGLAKLKSMMDAMGGLEHFDEVLFNANKTMEASIAERDAALQQVSQLKQQVQGMERKVEQAAQLLTDAASWNKSLQMEVSRLKKAQFEASVSQRRGVSESPAPRGTPQQDSSYIIQPSPYERGLGAVQRLDSLLNKSASEFRSTVDINIPSPAGGFPEGMLHSTGGASTLQYL